MPTLLLTSSTLGSVGILSYLWSSRHVSSLSTAAILPPITPVHITTLGTLSSFGGLTLLLSLLSDLLSLLLTAHLRLAYELACGVYWGTGVKLGGGLLWGVFRGTCPVTWLQRCSFDLIIFFSYTKGKRRNVLRNRTDTWSYDLDQLIFGTMLFTLIAFLFPTALVYYLLFAGVGFSQIFIHTMLTPATFFSLSSSASPPSYSKLP